MAKKRSVRVEKTENKARAEIRRFWLSKVPWSLGGTYGDVLALPDLPAAQLKRLPAPWRDYILFTLRGPATLRGPGPSSQNAARRSGKHDERNGRIQQAVECALNAGLKATRNRAQRDTGGAHSACSLVADELEAFGLYLSEDAVEKIWRQHPVYRIGS